MCGYYFTPTVTPSTTTGSPPRVRVLQKKAIRSVVESGITPACAGTTDFAQKRLNYFWDHPRVCGYYRVRL